MSCEHKWVKIVEQKGKIGGFQFDGNTKWEEATLLIVDSRISEEDP